MSEIEIIAPGDHFAVDPVASGVAHGFGVFETIRLKDGRLEFWDAHWQRLCHSADVLGLYHSFTQEDVLTATCELGKQLEEHALIKLSLLREGAGSRLLVYTRPFLPLPDEIGLSLDIHMPINERSPLAGHKTHNYMENVLARERAQGVGCYEVVRTDTRGWIAEAAMSNLFFIKNGQLKTPSEETGLLPGVVRAALIAQSQVEVGLYSVKELVNADVVFLTNASQIVLPVNWLDFESGRRVLLRSEDPVLSRIKASLASHMRIVSVPIK